MIRTTQSIHHDQVRHDTHADPFLFDFSQTIFIRFNKLLTNRTRVASSFLSFDFSVLDKAFLFHDVGPNARLQPIDRNDSSVADLVQISAQTAPPRGQKWLSYHRDLSPVDIPVPLGTARLKHCNFVLIQRFCPLYVYNVFPQVTRQSGLLHGTSLARNSWSIQNRFRRAKTKPDSLAETSTENAGRTRDSD